MATMYAYVAGMSSTRHAALQYKMVGVSTCSVIVKPLRMLIVHEQYLVQFFDGELVVFEACDVLKIGGIGGK